MNFKDYIAAADIQEAEKEYACFKYCLAMTNYHADKGNLNEANKFAEDMMKSLRELTDLSIKNNEEKHFNAFVKQMNAIGVNIEVIRGLNHEN